MIRNFYALFSFFVLLLVLVLDCGGRLRGRTSTRTRRIIRPASSSFFVVLLILVVFHCLTTIALQAAVDAVSVEVPEAKASTGQRLPFFVELRSKGSFGGATSFTPPEVSGVVIVKVGNPVVSSEQIEGESWFVQSHEFALFSQEDGSVEIPEFPVHFGTREGFTGPVTEVDAKVPAIWVKIERPPGTDPNRFLVTTESLSVHEKWDPQPGGNVEAGAVFKRTIRQSAKNMTGMALAPAPTRAPEGIRVYTGDAQVTDKTERGEFSGQRIETITYLVQQPGSYTLPAIRYDWWNPATQQLQSKTLPGLTFTATAPPASGALQASKKGSFVRPIWLLLPLALIILGWFYRKQIAGWLHRLHDQIDPPDRRAARAFRQACHRNDAAATEHAWVKWERLQSDFTPSGELEARLIELQRHLYGAESSPQSWKGAALVSAFRHRSANLPAPPSLASLPPLNP